MTALPAQQVRRRFLALQGLRWLPIGIGKKQTRERRRSTYLNVLTIYPEFPAPIASVDGQRDRKMRQVFNQLLEADVRGVDDTLDSTLA